LKNWSQRDEEKAKIFHQLHNPEFRKERGSSYYRQAAAAVAAANWPDWVFT